MEAATKKKKQRKQRWNDCNVIQVFPDLKRLWHFSVAEKQVVQKAKLKKELDNRPLAKKLKQSLVEKRKQDKINKEKKEKLEAKRSKALPKR